MKNIIRIIALSFSLIWIVGCNPDDNIEVGPSAQEYSPIEVGNFWEYQVDTTFYDDAGLTIINTSSFVRDEIIEKIDSTGSEPVFILERSWKKEADGAYKETNLWKVRFDKGDLIRSEENLDILSIQSPIVNDDSWDGILFDNSIIVEFKGESLQMYKSWDFKVLEFQMEDQIGNFMFDDLLVVQQADDENFIEKRYSVEKYQKGVGLVYKNQIILDTQCISDCMDDLWTEKAEKGIIMEMILIAHNQ